MTTALTTVNHQPAVPAIPMSDMERMATAIAKSQLFGVKNPDQALALMLVAQAEGLHPAIAARDYDIIQGRPAKKSEAMLRDFIGSGGKIEWHKLDDTVADATFSHPSGGKVRIAWDMERARKAGLGGKDMWKKYPRQMLRSRCISEGIRTVCPMATSGMYVPEEVRDFDDSPEPRNRVEAKVNDAPPPQAPPEPEDEGQGLDIDTVEGHLLNIKGSADMTELKGAFGAAYLEAEKARDDKAMQAFIAAKDARKAELGGGSEPSRAKALALRAVEGEQQEPEHAVEGEVI